MLWHLEYKYIFKILKIYMDIIKLIQCIMSSTMMAHNSMSSALMADILMFKIQKLPYINR